MRSSSSPNRRSPSPTRAHNWRMQVLVMPLLLLLVASLSLNVLVLEHTQRNAPSSVRIEARKAGEVRKRQLSSVQPAPSARPALSDARTLQSKSAQASTESDRSQQTSNTETISASVVSLQDSHTPSTAPVPNTFNSGSGELQGKHFGSDDTVKKLETHTGDVKQTATPPGISESSIQRVQNSSSLTAAQPMELSSLSFQFSDAHDGTRTLTNSRNLAIGLAQAVDESNIAVFIASLRRFSSCTIVFFANGVSEQATRLFQRYGVVIVQFELTQLPRSARSYQAETYRWFLFQRFLEDNSNKYDKVLIADVDDTAFQSDPFVIAQTPGVIVGSNNDKWIDKGRSVALLQLCYGKNTANSLGKQEVTENGVLLGSPVELLSYLKQLTESMSTPEFATCQKKGSDQAAHHALQHGASIRGLQVLNQADGGIAHLGAGKMKLTKNETVVNEAGVEAPIVHEYDVHTKFAAKLYNKYVDKDLRFDKKGRGKCRAYMLQSNVLPYDSGSVLVHFTPEPALSLDRCCEMCSERAASGCMGFIYERERAMCIFKGPAGTSPGGLVMPGATSGVVVR